MSGRSEWQRHQIGFDPFAASPRREQPIPRPVRHQPAGTALRRRQQVAQNLGERPARNRRQGSTGNAQRSEGDGSVIALRIAVHAAGSDIVVADDVGQVARPVEPGPAAQQPQRRREMRGMGPLAPRQRAIEQAAGKALDGGIVKDGGARRSHFGHAAPGGGSTHRRQEPPPQRRFDLRARRR